MTPIKSVAVIGAGPAGAIAVDALAQEQAFDVIRVFERQARAGGTWIQDTSNNKHQYPDLDSIAARTCDHGLPIPADLPAAVPRNDQYRFSETSIYPLLETNISAQAMSFSQEPFPAERTALNISRHGADSPFRHWKVVGKWVESLFDRKGYNDLVSYSSSVELIQKDETTGKWKVTIRQALENGTHDKWWTESFDAIVVASGHYFVPWIPAIPGLKDLERNFPGTVDHSKAWRGPEKYRSKRVVVVGASISGADISWSTVEYAETPLISVTRGRYHPYFSDWAFKHPNIQERPQITKITSDKLTQERTVYFDDGSKLEKVDHIIFGTGYTWTLPYLPKVTIRNNRILNIYQHVFWRNDPTLTFVGATSSGFTFKVFEWQAVLAARFLAGRISLPPIEQQIKWEQDRIAYKGDGAAFAALNPDFEEYFESTRKLAGEPTSDGKGRPLPEWQQWWLQDFTAGHLRRIAMWKNGNEEARERIRKQKEQKEQKGQEGRLEVKIDEHPNLVRKLEITKDIRVEV